LEHSLLVALLSLLLLSGDVDVDDDDGHDDDPVNCATGDTIAEWTKR